MAKINTVKQKPNVVYKYNNPKVLFELPDVDKGYYLLEFNRDGTDEKNYHFLQINDMLIYNAFFDNEILVFAADGANSKGIVDAGVVVNDEHLGFTDDNGILYVNKDTSVYEDETISMRIEAKGYSDFIYAEGFYFGEYFYRSQNEAYKYLRYIDTDRPVYLPTDKINVWGFARHKDNKSINQVKIELLETNTDLVLDSKTADLTDIGTYQTEFEIKNITSENCQINVYDNDIKISTKYISIGEYTKPLYTLNGEFNKEFVYSGEDINYKINANFFDGYPVPNLEVNYETSFSNYSGSVLYETMNSTDKLNEQGEIGIDVNTGIISDGWRPVTIYMNSWNAGAEDKTVCTRVYNEEMNTVDGIVNIKIPNYNSERSYKVVAHYVEGNGITIEESYVSGAPYYYEKLYYSLEKTDDNKNYRLNDNVNLQLTYNNENVENIENDKLVLLVMRDGLIDYKTIDNTNAALTFNEDYIPNVMINSVYIKNGYMYPVEILGYLNYV